MKPGTPRRPHGGTREWGPAQVPLARWAWAVSLTTLALVGARWVYPPGTALEQVACLDACAAVCGLSESREGSVADLACWRRLLAGEIVACP